jgi:four helix bundle protein
MTVATTTTTTRAMQKVAVWRDAADLAELVDRRSATLPPEDKDWLTDPIRHAARSAADRIADAWKNRGDAAIVADRLTRAESDVHEVQTWALLAMRHGHWSPRVADEVDQRCEALLDQLVAITHHAPRWAKPPVRQAA